MQWLAPQYRATPGEALQRIEAICAMHGELCQAVFVVMATHSGLPAPILAAAIKQFRRDTDALTREDVMGLMTALANGGRQGFEAVLRTRKSAPRQASGFPWAQA